VTLALWREARAVVPRRFPWPVVYFLGVTLVFAYTLAQNVRERPDGVIIASIFITIIVLLSALSRYLRAFELRVESLEFADSSSESLWAQLLCKKVNLVPLKHCAREDIDRKTAEIRQHYTVRGPIAFLHVNLLDDRSDFTSPLRVKVSQLQEGTADGDTVIEVEGAVAIANVIAYLSELIDPISIFLGLTRQNSVSQAVRYLLWGEGETGILVYEILLRHWDRTPEDDVRPLIFLMSE
jgi:hypothetical protein